MKQEPLDPFLDVLTFSKRAGVLLLTNGFLVPITNWLDIDGDECDPDDALTCVGGHGDRWYVVRLSDYEDDWKG